MSLNSDDSIPDSNSEPTAGPAIGSPVLGATAIGKPGADQPGAGKASAHAAGPHPAPANQDADHLRLLSIFHYLAAAGTGLLSLFPLLHVAIGVAILTGQFEPTDGEPPPAFFGWMFVVFPLVIILVGLATAVAIAIAGRKLQRQTGYLYCLTIAAVECLFMPLGTILGVFTILVLLRPSVKERFGVTPTTP